MNAEKGICKKKNQWMRKKERKKERKRERKKMERLQERSKNNVKWEKVMKYES